MSSVLMNQALTKTKQIENILSEKIKSIYQYKLEHQLDGISLKIFDKTIIVIMEGTMTYPERLLQENNRTSLAKRLEKRSIFG